MSHIFISYSRKDSTCVNAVANQMQKLDYPIWMDAKDITVTDIWLDKIESKIRASSVFMLFWSKNAEESDYVPYELRIAKQLVIENKIKIIIIRLDDTTQPMSHIQSYDMRDGCNPVNVKAFIDTLDPEWRKFSITKPLESQHNTPIDGKYLSVLFDKNEYCKAYIVGEAKSTLASAPNNLAVCLQFSRSNNMVLDVVSGLPEDTLILYITGPVDKKNDQFYGLDNNDPAQWEASRAFIVKTIQSVGRAANTTLHFYTLTPNALLGGVSMSFYRFWHVKFYNLVGSKYQEELDIPRDGN